MENETNGEIDLSTFAIDELVKTTYSKIVDWHNSDASAPGLKWLSVELIEDICGATFKHLGIPYAPTIKVDKPVQENKLKSADEMTDDELLEEIEKRKAKEKL